MVFKDKILYLLFEIICDYLWMFLSNYVDKFLLLNNRDQIYNLVNFEKGKF